MLKTRVISAVIGIPLLLGILYCEGLYAKGLFVLLALLILNEYHRMMANAKFKPVVIPGYLLLLLILFLPFFVSRLLSLIFLALVLAVIYMIFKFPRFSFIDLALSLFAPVCFGFLLSYALRIVDLRQAFLVLLLAFLLTWSSDIGGYFAGRLWGRRKLAPLLSPAKTWEGAMGATILPMLVAIIFFMVVHMESIPLAYVLLLGITAGVLAQCGDLFESGMKRYFGVKDSGNIIPGHGGVLDRFDSFLFVAPLVYYFLIYMVY